MSAPRGRSRSAAGRSAAAGQAGKRPVKQPRDSRALGLALVGHGEARRQIEAELASGSLAPVLLVTGPRGIGKEAFAFWIARLLLCVGADPRPCESCPSCIRIAGLAHPDVHWFFPLPTESSFGEAEWAGLLEKIRKEPLNPAHRRFSQPASFRMHQTSVIRRLAATKPFEGGERVFVLGDYEQNPSDQVHNALLKVLEEPPARSTFVLTTCRLQGLPATILSRCRRVRLAPLAPGEMREFLNQAAARADLEVTEDRTREIVGRAEGRPGRALEMLHEQDSAAAEAAALLEAVVRGGPTQSYAFALTTNLRGSREDHDRRLDALAALWRDLLRLRSGSPDTLARPGAYDTLARTGARHTLARTDPAGLRREAAERLDPARAAGAALEIERARERIQANVFAPLVFWKLFRALALAFEPPCAAST